MQVVEVEGRLEALNKRTSMPGYADKTPDSVKVCEVHGLCTMKQARRMGCRRILSPRVCKRAGARDILVRLQAEDAEKQSKM